MSTVKSKAAAIGPEGVAEALEYAYESLTEDLLLLKNGETPAYQDVHRWEMMTVCSNIRGVEIVKIDDEYFVENGDELVPRFGGGPGDWHRVYDDEKGELLIAKAADGDQVAHNVLCSIAAPFVAGNCNMPPNLRDYIADVLRIQGKEAPHRARGKNPYANHSRNFWIACTVLNVIKLGFRPTKNRATQGESACSIVAKALARRGIHMTDAAVEKIWEQFSRVFREELNKS